MAKADNGKRWDPKDKAYEYDTKQPGTHWDAKDHAWEGPPQSKQPDKKGSSQGKQPDKFRAAALKKRFVQNKQ